MQSTEFLNYRLKKVLNVFVERCWEEYEKLIAEEGGVWIGVMPPMLSSAVYDPDGYEIEYNKEKFIFRVGEKGTKRAPSNDITIEYLDKRYAITTYEKVFPFP